MKLIAALASLVSLATAHGGVGYYVIDGTTYQGWSPYNSVDSQKSIQRLYSSYNPLLLADLSSVNIRCNNAGSLGTGVSAPVTAGGTILAHWTQWTHRPAAAIVYMAKCPSSGCNSWDGSGTVWFKVSELGLVSGTLRDGKWAGDQIVDTLEYSFKVPASLASGDYLIRHELIALHQSLNPQLYPECAQLTVSGAGTETPSGSYLVAFPGAYKASDPGLTMNIDAPSATVLTTYNIPGPSVWPGSGTGGGSNPVVTPSAAPTTLVTSAAPASSAPAACAVARYGQCGGNGYSGCTSCASGSTCMAQGDYYSQCT